MNSMRKTFSLTPFQLHPSCSKPSCIHSCIFFFTKFPPQPWKPGGVAGLSDLLLTTLQFVSSHFCSCLTAVALILALCSTSRLFLACLLFRDSPLVATSVSLTSRCLSVIWPLVKYPKSFPVNPWLTLKYISSLEHLWTVCVTPITFESRVDTWVKAGCLDHIYLYIW